MLKGLDLDLGLDLGLDYLTGDNQQVCLKG